MTDCDRLRDAAAWSEQPSQRNGRHSDWRL